MFFVDVIRGRKPLALTFWVFWALPQLVIRGIQYLFANGITESGTHVLTDGQWIIAITLWFISLGINLTFGVGVVLSYLNQGSGIWGGIGALSVAVMIGHSCITLYLYFTYLY